MKPEVIWLIVKSIAIVLCLSIFSYGSYTIIDNVVDHFNLQNKLIKEEMIQLSKNIASQKVEYNEKKLEEKIELLSESIIKLVKSRDQEINQFGEIISRLESRIGELESDKYIDNSDPQKTFDQTLVYTKDSEGKNFPIAHVLYNPYLESDNKWTTRTYPIKFYTQIALGENKDRSDAYVQLWMENDDIADYAGKKFPVTIEKVEWIKRPPKEKKFMWNPRVSLGASLSNVNLYPDLGLSLLSYGRTNRDMDWTFLRFGIGGNDNYFHLQCSPFEYNLGNHLPLIQNLFCGPFIGYSLDLDGIDSYIIYGMSLDVPF